MDRPAAPILPLSADVVAQVKSSANITSLVGVVLELVRNSLDAGARKLDIDVDFRRGGCTVEDDGLGIAPSDFRESGGLGRMYHTSKYPPSAEIHGRYGTFLSMLAGLSLLTITSHHHEHRSHNSIAFFLSKPISRRLPAPPHQHLACQAHGTRVTVKNLFGNLPVRVKQRALAANSVENAREWEALRKGIVELLVAWRPDAGITVRDVETDRKLLIRPNISSKDTRNTDKASRPTRDTEISRGPNVSHVQRVLSQASYDIAKTWVPLTARSSRFTIRGAISLEPAPSKSGQFISFGVRPIAAASGHNIMFEEVNRVFAASSFGRPSDGGSLADQRRKSRHDDYTGTADISSHKTGRKAIDKWPVFVLRIDLLQTSFSDDLDDILDSSDDLNSILLLLRAAIKQFLEEHHFQPHVSISPNKKQRTSSKGIRLRKEETATSTQSRSPQRSLVPPDSKSARSRAESELNDESLSRMHEQEAPVRMPSDGIRVPRFSIPPSSIPELNISSLTKAKSAKQGFFDGLHPIKSGGHAGPEKPTHPITVVPNYDAMASLPMRPHSSAAFEISGELPILKPDYREEARYDTASQARDFVDGRLGSEKGPDASEEIVPDDVIEWINPATKTKHLVNSRTGFIIAQEGKSIRPASMPCKRSLLISRGSQRSSDGHNRNTSLPLQSTDSTWLDDVLTKWKNPVYKPAEKAIPRLVFEGTRSIHTEDQINNSCCRTNGPDDADSSILYKKLSRDGLANSEVIAQIDRKFILVKLESRARRYGLSGDSYPPTEMLAMIDQHAADERCRIEELLSELCTPVNRSDALSSTLGLPSPINSTALNPAVVFEVSQTEQGLFERHARRFAEWGILFGIKSSSRSQGRSHSSGATKVKTRITVEGVPPSIIERCKAEPTLLIDMMRADVWRWEESGSLVQASHEESPSAEKSKDEWIRRIGTCPRGLLDMLNSRSCRSAIMFNDELSLEECRALVSRLAQCAFPFRCAHGRPSMVPLAELGDSLSLAMGMTCLGDQGSASQRDEGLEFRQALKRWKAGDEVEEG